MGRNRDVGIDMLNVDFMPRTFSELTNGLLNNEIQVIVLQ